MPLRSLAENFLTSTRTSDDASKAKKQLGWEPMVTFQQLVNIMVDADLADVERKIRGGAEAVRLVEE